jgi:hypothetical protein
MRKFANRHGLTIILAIGIAACSVFGWRLERRAFTPASPPGQASAVVFVQNRKATVHLTATVHPDYPWRDTLKVQVSGPPAKRDHWLLVIECPPGSANSPHPGVLVSEPAAQTPVPTSTVTTYSGTGLARTVKLGCFIRTRSNSLNKSNTPGYASIGSVTIPALETDSAMQSAVASPRLYEGWKTSGGPAQLIQVFPGAACPPAPAATPSVSTTAAAASTTNPPPGATYGRGTSPSPSPGIPTCFGQTQAGEVFNEYHLPAVVQAKETLTNVNLAGYQVESIFPAPQITPDRGHPGQDAEENYTWDASSSLSPSLMVSNLAGQQTVSHYTFVAGVLLGIAGGAVATFLECIWPYIFPKHKRARKRGSAKKEPATKRFPPVPIGSGPEGP